MLPEIITVASVSPGWWIHPEPIAQEGGQPEPQRLVALALVADPQSAPWVCGLVVAEDGQTIELAPAGIYEHRPEPTTAPHPVARRAELAALRAADRAQRGVPIGKVVGG